jgi:hypothetical protein
MIGGCLPVERTTESSSLKHCGNAMHKEKKLRILRLGLKTGIDRYLTKTVIGGKFASKHSCSLLWEEKENVWNRWIYWK